MTKKIKLCDKCAGTGQLKYSIRSPNIGMITANKSCPKCKGTGIKPTLRGF